MYCVWIVMICKENHLRNGHTVDLPSWQMYPEGLVWTYFWCKETLLHLQSLKVMNGDQSCFYKLEWQGCLSGTSSCSDLVNLVNINRPFINFVLIFIELNEWSRAIVVWKILKEFKGLLICTVFIHICHVFQLHSVYCNCY